MKLSRAKVGMRVMFKRRLNTGSYEKRKATIEQIDKNPHDNLKLFIKTDDCFSFWVEPKECTPLVKRKAREWTLYVAGCGHHQNSVVRPLNCEHCKLGGCEAVKVREVREKHED
jgi:hypothetical protein